MASSNIANPSPEDLLHYCKPHEVLICTSCRYAIQPGALARHLRDIHHIYRSNRRPYLSYTHGMRLRSPEDITPPHPDQFPVPHLLVEQGLRCMSPGCDHLCVSTKRMEVHWSAVHGRRGSPDHDWSPAPLQTFFRGNMLRYFTADPAPSSALPHTVEPALLRKISQVMDLDDMDTFILDHYFTSTHESFLFGDHSDNDNMWLDVVPRIGCDNLFLIHGILSCTALHIACTEPSESDAFTIRAMVHQEKAMPLFRDAVDHPDGHNCHAILVFAFLLTIYAVAVDADNATHSLFMVDDSASRWNDKPAALPSWLHLIRSGCIMLCDVWTTIEKGPVAPIAHAWEMYDDLTEFTDGSKPYLSYFLSIVPNDGSWSEDAVKTYQESAQLLSESFAFINGQHRPSRFTIWNAIAVWPTRVEDDYVALLATRHPGALILMAYYCIILKRLNAIWYFHGRAEKVLTSIIRSLDERWQEYIQDPVDLVLGTKDPVVSDAQVLSQGQAVMVSGYPVS